MDFNGRTITSAALRFARAPLLLVLLSLTAACTTNGSGPVATTASFGPTVAFESVDGPPPQVSDRLVRKSVV